MTLKYISFLKRLSILSGSKLCRNKSVNFPKIMETSCKIKLSERLTPAVYPVHYSLHLNPNLKSGLFDGKVIIDVNVKEEKNFLALHTKFIDIDKIEMFRNNDEISISKYLEVKSLEQLLVQFDDQITPGNYQLHINFHGNLTRNIVGFYLSYLKNKR